MTDRNVNPASGVYEPMDHATAVLHTGGEIAAADPVVIEVGTQATVSPSGLDFEQFFYDNHAPLARALALTLGDADLAADAANEAMARAFQRWTRVHELDNPGGWVYRVGLNWARSVLRKHRRRDALVFHARPLELASSVEPAIGEAIAALSLDHRTVVVCRHLLDWSVEETAAALGIRPGTVQSRLHRANRQLQERLAHLRHEPHDRDGRR